jgi:hypothetical protein
MDVNEANFKRNRWEKLLKRAEWEKCCEEKSDEPEASIIPSLKTVINLNLSTLSRRVLSLSAKYDSFSQVRFNIISYTPYSTMYTVLITYSRDVAEDEHFPRKKSICHKNSNKNILCPQKHATQKKPLKLQLNFSSKTSNISLHATMISFGSKPYMCIWSPTINNVTATRTRIEGSSWLLIRSLVEKYCTKSTDLHEVTTKKKSQGSHLHSLLMRVLMDTVSWILWFIDSQLHEARLQWLLIRSKGMGFHDNSLKSSNVHRSLLFSSWEEDPFTVCFTLTLFLDSRIHEGTTRPTHFFIHSDSFERLEKSCSESLALDWFPVSILLKLLCYSCRIKQGTG